MPPGDDDGQPPFPFELNYAPEEDDPTNVASSGPATGPAWKTQTGSNLQERGSQRIIAALSDSTPNPRPKRLITETYGTGPRGGPNVRGAARDLGVHPSTVYRWLKQGPPKRPTAAIDQLRATWRNSPKGRRAAISTGRRQRLTAGTAPIGGSVRGNVWIDTSDPRNGQARGFNFTMSPEDSRRMMEALLAGDDATAHRIWQSSLQGFGASVDVDIQSIEFRL